MATFIYSVRFQDCIGFENALDFTLILVILLHYILSTKSTFLVELSVQIIYVYYLTSRLDFGHLHGLKLRIFIDNLAYVHSYRSDCV